MRTIRKHRPKLAISLYHQIEDMIRIPMMIMEIGVDYHFYMGCHTLHGTDQVLYAVPVRPFR